MRRLVSAALRHAPVIALAMSPVLALLAACGDGTPRTRSAGDVPQQRAIGPDARDFECPTREPSDPTPIPTQDITVENLSQWSGTVTALHRGRMDELQTQLVEARASFAGVERRETLIDGWSEPVSAADAAARADALIVGKVTAQYLDYASNDRGDFFVLVSEIETADGVVRLAQDAYVGCVSDGPQTDAHIVLGKNPVHPLDFAARYAIFAEHEPAVAMRRARSPGTPTKSTMTAPLRARTPICPASARSPASTT
ncbi:MAG: hypothetical protein WEB52_13500 [Dehalococcoidia bacterium]